MKTSRLIYSIGALTTALMFANCQDEDYGFTRTEIRDAVYDRNFIAKYGEIDPDQSWDLSRYAVDKTASFPTRALPNRNDCKFDNDASSWLSDRLSIVEDWYYAEPSLIAEFNQRLGEGVDNTSQGGPFSLSSNGTPFYILPIFQGVSGIVVDLHMVVTYNGQTYDKQIWDKSQNIQKQDPGSLNWKEITEKYDPWSTYGGKSEYEANYVSSTYGAFATRTKPIKCMIPAGASIKFYLHVTKGHLRTQTTEGEELFDNDLAFTDSKQWSDGGKMIALNENFTVSDATKQRFGQQVYIIGCEDASYGTEDVNIYNNDGSVKKTYHVGDEYDGKDASGNYKKGKITQWSGDNDMNDLVFMFIADELPEIVEEGVIKKRYLIEDLGSVADWDFNDIVVDMYQKSENGQVVEQKAMIRQKCGTTDFDIYLKRGETRSESIFGHHQGEVRWSSTSDYWKQPMAENASGTIITYVDLSSKKINGEWPWDPENNNIQVLVYPETNNIDESVSGYKGEGNGLSGGNNGGYGYGGVNSSTTDPTNQNMSNSALLVQFPKRGSVPRILAVDTDFPWTAENQDIDPNIWTYYVITSDVQMQSGAGDPGVVAGAGRYRAGSSVTLKALANPGYDFVYWNDDHNNTNPERNITVSSATNYTAIFKQGTTPQQAKYTIKVSRENTNGSITYGVNPQSGNCTVSDPWVVKIPTVVDGKPNDDGVWFKATPSDGYYFSHWSDENGNIHTDQNITVKSDAEIVAHFVPAKTLTIRINQEDLNVRDASHEIQLYVKDGNNVSKLNITNGVATKTVTNDNVQVIANVAGLNLRDVKWQWSVPGSTNGKDTYETWDVGTGQEENITGNFTNVSAEAKKTINVPETGKVVTLGITYQVLAFLTLKQGSDGHLPTEGETPGDGEVNTKNNVKYWRKNNDNAPWGSAKFNGNARQTYLHKNSVFNLQAEAKPGYHFAYWAYNFDDVQGNDVVLRNQSNSAANGMYFIDAVFEENTLRTLTLKMTNSNDQDEKLSFIVNGRTATGSNGTYTVQVPEGAPIKITAKHNDFTADWNKNYVKFQLSSGTLLENNTATTLNNYMPSYDLTIDISNILYRVAVQAKLDDSNVNDYSSIADIKINNGTDNPIFLAEGVKVPFYAAAKSGYTFSGWKYGGWEPKTATIYTHEGEGKSMTIDANFTTAAVAKSRVTVSVNNNAAGTVKINNGTASTQVSGDYDKGTQLTLTASQANSGYAFEKWSSGAYTYTRTLDVQDDTHNVTANYLAGAMIFDHADSPVQVNGARWATLDYIKNDGDYQQWFTALKDFMNGKSSVKLHIYCTNDSQGTFQLTRYYGGDNGWEMNYYISGNTFTLNNGYAEVTLDSGAINAINESNGLVIQRTDENNQSASFIRIIVTAN